MTRQQCWPCHMFRSTLVCVGNGRSGGGGRSSDRFGVALLQESLKLRDPLPEFVPRCCSSVNHFECRERKKNIPARFSPLLAWGF